MAENSDSFRDGVELERWAVNPTVTLRFGSGQHPGRWATSTCNDERTADRGIPSQNGRPFNTDPGTFFGNAGQSTRAFVRR